MFKRAHKAHAEGTQAGNADTHPAKAEGFGKKGTLKCGDDCFSVPIAEERDRGGAYGL